MSPPAPSCVDEEAARRAVVVTGASSATGLATAARLARAGHLVVLGDRRGEICESAASRLRAEGAIAFAARLDLSDPSSIDEFVESARYLVGPVDVLVSFAGRPLAAATPDHRVRSIIDADVLGAQHLAAQMIPAMVDRGSGDLVFVATRTSMPAPGAVSRRRIVQDAASKDALEAWVAVLRAELAGSGVRASIVRPGHNVEPDDSDDIARVIGFVIARPERMQLRLVEVVPSAPRTVEATN